MSQFRSDMIVTFSDGTERIRLTAESVGRKAMGLNILPPAWRPPFAILTTEMHSAWRSANAHERDRLIAAASEAITRILERWGEAWPRGVILRSSAVKETLADRGALDSSALAADFDSQKIAARLASIFNQSEQMPEMGGLALVLQPLAPAGRLGHLSNERRVSKTVNHWMWEWENGEPPGRFNSQRSKPPSVPEPLLATTSKELIAVFRSVGRWCTELQRGPTHLEYSWDYNRLWLLQLDFEDDSPDDGIDPRRLIIGADESPANSPLPGSAIREVDLADAPTGWNKVDKVREFLRVRATPYPRLYLTEGDAIGDVSALEREVAQIATRRIVCRTDCKSSTLKSLNLPRTDSVSPSQAAAFMCRTLDNLVQRGARRSEVAFILHKFIPAQSSAWALAEPGKQIVQVDSLWGVPDGLQYLAHDSFEFDARRGDISAERLRYKSTIIQETEDGSWHELKISRRLARHRSLSAPDVREVADLTHKIAGLVGEPTLIMWFCGIPEGLGIGRNLPWFMMKPEAGTERARPRISPQDLRVHVRNADDLTAENLDQHRRSVLALEPQLEFVRNEEFLDKVIAVAQERKLPVELQGSTLSHAYYTLVRSGITVVLADESKHSRARQLQVFGKMVRDEIPAKIEQRGERAILARISKAESRAALLTKLLEEVHELRSAESPEEVMAELADVHEVVRSLSAVTGVDWMQVEKAAEEKRRTRGSFGQGVVLLKTAWPSRGQEGQPEVREIALKALGRTLTTTAGGQLAYAALFAQGADATLRLPSGVRVRISFEKEGVKVEEIAETEPVPEQMSFGFVQD
jgi:predicted house-cleaning noncanonical NTP pyrophosphatase (MazG superfamily)